MKTTYEYAEILKAYTLGTLRERVNDCYLLRANRYNGKRCLTINTPDVQIDLRPDECVFVRKNRPPINNMVTEDWYMKFADDYMYTQSYDYQIQKKITDYSDIPILDLVEPMLPDFVCAGIHEVIFNESPQEQVQEEYEYVQVPNGFTWLNFREMLDFFIGRHINSNVIPFGDQIFAFINPNVTDPLLSLYSIDIVLNMANQEVYNLSCATFIVGKIIFGYQEIGIVIKFPTDVTGSVIRVKYTDDIPGTLRTHRYNLLLDQIIRAYCGWSITQTKNRMNKIID